MLSNLRPKLVNAGCRLGPLSRLMVAILAGMFAFGTNLADVESYSLTGFRLDHRSVTYSCGSTELREAVQAWADVSKLTDGGCSSSPDIRLEIVSSNDWAYGDALGVARPGYVAISQAEEHSANLYVHEVGHALGLGHSSESFGELDLIKRSSAMFFICCNPINSDDVAGIVSLYGSETNRYFLANVSVE